MQITVGEKPQLKKISFPNYKHSNEYNRQSFKGTVMNRTLPSLRGGSREITRSVPLTRSWTSVDILLISFPVCDFTWFSN